MIDPQDATCRRITGLPRRQPASAGGTQVIQKPDPDSVPILGIVLAGNTSLGGLTVFATDVVKPRLESVPSVGASR